MERQKNPDTAGIWNIYYMVGFLVILVSGLLLIIFGWGALANKFVAVVAGLIPFSLATGLIAQFYPKYEKSYLGLMVIGLVLIAVTRYGNVMASRGSVIPLFINQIKTGKPITVTEPHMTRFLMSLDDAVDLVLYAYEHGHQGDTFVQKAPASTIGA